MKKHKNILTEAEILRLKAEERLNERESKISSESSENDMRKLLHELQVHQIELEMQNEELITAKSKIEELAEKYKELYDFAPSGYITLSKNGEITELNFSAARMLGKERSLLMKKKFEDFISADTQTTFNVFFHNIYSGKENQSCELIIEKPIKLPIHIIVNGVLDKNLNFCQLTLVDNTEKKLAQTKLSKAKLKAEESDRLKSAFLANMSHEIRTPMNGILGFAELLKSPELNTEKQQKYISIIEKGGERLLHTINEIIDISKIESGQMKVSTSNVNINNCLEEIYSFFKNEAEKKQIELKLTKLVNDNEAIIKTDLDKLNGILSNLINNAIKFTMKGSIEFGVSTSSTTKSTSSTNKLNSEPAKVGSEPVELDFYVKDTGIGIRNSRQSAIFNRFIREDIENTMAHQGSGLGLAISKAYIEMLDGRIWLESKENIGSTFYFTLPYITGKTPEIEYSDYQSEKTKQVKGIKILIVEDDETSSQYIEISVKRYGEEIIIVKTGKEAINVCHQNPDIDLILMDIQLPNINGYEATRQIRKFNKEVIIIAQTAFALYGDREKSIAAGCNDYISKPINKAELDNLIQKYITQ